TSNFCHRWFSLPRGGTIVLLILRRRPQVRFQKAEAGHIGPLPEVAFSVRAVDDSFAASDVQVAGSLDELGVPVHVGRLLSHNYGPPSRLEGETVWFALFGQECLRYAGCEACDHHSTNAWSALV